MSDSSSSSAGLPASGLITTLLDRYYATAADEAGASSHWRHYAKQFEVTRDAGTLVDLKGVGFGNASWGSWLHRAADAASIALHIARLPRRGAHVRGYRRLARVCRAMGVAPTFDAFRQLCTLELLEHSTGSADGRRFVIIGDGHGILAALIKDRWPGASITLIDLGRTLLFQAVNCQRAYPRARHALAGTAEAAGRVDFLYCPADRLDSLESHSFDIAINVASMQEMTPETVAAYFAFLRRRLAADNVFYCCNRERKQLPGGEVSAFLEYPWRGDDRILLDEPCPWHQFYLAPGARVLRRYDGVHRHRLAALATESR